MQSIQLALGFSKKILLMISNTRLNTMNKKKVGYILSIDPFSSLVSHTGLKVVPCLPISQTATSALQDLLRKTHMI